MITLEIKGLEEIKRQLRTLPEKLQRRALSKALRQAANVIRDRARQTAPVGSKSYYIYDPRVRGGQGRKRTDRGRIHRPGYLRKFGVTSKKLKSRSRFQMLYGVGFSKRGFYGRWIERGKNKKHRLAERPFVKRALEAKAQQAVDTFTDRFGDELKLIVSETKGIVLK